MSSLMLQYPSLKHTEKTNYVGNHDMKNRIISTMKEIYENYITKSYPLILSMPEMDQYQHSIHDQIWQLLKYI